MAPLLVCNPGYAAETLARSRYGVGPNLVHLKRAANRIFGPTVTPRCRWSARSSFQSFPLTPLFQRSLDFPCFWWRRGCLRS